MCLTDFGMGGGRSEYRNKHYLCIRNKGRKPPQKGEKKAFTVFLEKTVLFRLRPFSESAKYLT